MTHEVSKVWNTILDPVIHMCASTEQQVQRAPWKQWCRPQTEETRGARFPALEVSTKGYEAYSSWICRSINLTQGMENFTRKLK